VLAHPTLRFDTFSFTHRALAGRGIRLGYALASRSGPRLEFEETFELPASLGALAGAGHPAVQRALLGLHLAAGTSYWKTCLPRELVVEGASLTEDDARFWTDLYTLGLGEFFYRNELDPTGRASFRASPSVSVPAEAPGSVRSAELLLWGGGKDSVVSHEVLRQAGARHELLSIGSPDWEWVRRSAEVAGAPLHVVTRRLDPKLLELNAAGAWNGHVPVNAVLAFAGAAIALLTGRPRVIASNEASASFGNALWHGIDVNHQWSKSLAFERMMRRWLRENLGAAPEYVSLLRPLTELRIVKAFATHPAYFGSATSCNTNFKQTGPAARRWCHTCPKCVFVALMARPWLDDREYHALFAGDPLADPGNVSIVEELLGLKGTKPFECVGTPEETVAAIHLARTRGHAVPHGIMTALAGVAGGMASLEELAEAALARSGDHELSPSLLAQLDDYLARH